MKTIGNIIILIGLVACLSACSAKDPQGPAYYLEIRGESIYVVNGLGDCHSMVGRLSDWDDPESIAEVLETQVGWESGLAASQAYFYLIED